eukprot:800487_1
MLLFVFELSPNQHATPELFVFEQTECNPRIVWTYHWCNQHDIWHTNQWTIRITLETWMIINILKTHVSDIFFQIEWFHVIKQQQIQYFSLDIYWLFTLLRRGCYNENMYK